MKRVIKSAGVVLGVIILCAVIFVVIFSLRARSEMKSMKPLQTGKVAERVYALNDKYVNMYFVKTGNKFIAIDAANDINIVTEEMKKLAIDPAAVEAVFLTHADSDHTASIALFKNAKIYITETEEQMVNGKTRRLLVFHNKIPAGYKLLKDNQSVKIGDTEIKAVFSPGHTPGSACFIVSNEYLFTGDTMRLKDGKAAPFIGLFNMDTPAEKSSITRLSGLYGIKFIFTAHDGMSDDFKKAFGSWRE